MVAKLEAARPRHTISSRIASLLPKPSFMKFMKFKKLAAPRVILSMDGRAVKMLCVSGPPAAPEIKLAKIIAITESFDEAAAGELRQALVTAGVHRAETVVSCSSFFMRASLLKLPSTDMKELQTMVDLEVEKTSPDAKDETLSYFKVLSAQEDGYSRVFLVMTHSDVVRRSVHIAQRLGGRLTHVTSDLDGLIHWFREARKKRAEPEHGAVLLADVDQDRTTLMVVHNKMACFHRSVPIGATHVDCTEKLLEEFERSIMVFKEDARDLPIDEVVVTGLTEGCFQEAEVRLGVDTVVPLSVLPALPGLKLPAESAEEARAGSFAALAGFVFGTPEGDLTPTVLKLRRRFEERVRMAMIASGQVLFAFVLAAGIFLKAVQEDISYEHSLARKMQSMEKDSLQVETSLTVLKEVKRRMEQRGKLLQSVLDINQATPQPVQWESFSYTKGSGVLLKGFSEEMPEVFKMVTELEKSGLFLQAKPQRVAKRKVEEKDVTAFEIDAPFFEREGDEIPADIPED